MNANKNNLRNAATKNRMPNMPKDGTHWTDWAAQSVIKDDELRASKQAPAEAPKEAGQQAPSSNFPY